MKRFALSLGSRTLAAPLAFALGGALAQGHPGHGLQEASTAHLLTSPYHLAVLVMAGAGLLFAGRFVQRRLPRRVLQGAGFTALVGAFLLWGLQF